MSVSISIDKPDVTVAVSAYDGYTEAGGVSVPLVLGEVQSQKGDASVAAGITASAVLGDAVSTKGNGSVAGGVVATAVAGDAQSQKGDASQADGVSSATVLGDAQSEKGDASVADGMSLPVVMGAVQTTHLKPTHRWQMPLPRQLAQDPEAFDPSTTAWGTTTGATYAETVQNVGPNGETATQIDFDGTTDAGLVQSLSLSSHSPFTQGFYVRAVSGTQDVMASHTDGGTVEDGSIVTVSTDWQWVDPTITPSGTLDQIGLRSDVAGSIYVLRAGLNRGSALEYSTRSAVPQTIPDVITGGDLENGSDGSNPDTNDLDFAVDGDGVPYAVSDGDDETENLDAYLGGGCWFVRYYMPSDSGNYTVFGTGRYEIQNRNDQTRVDLFVTDKNSNRVARIPHNGGNGKGWHTAVIVQDGVTDTVRFHHDGFISSASVDVSALSPTQRNQFEAGVRQQHLEKHPVLSEAGAEAVRTRLASNPADPIPKTEAWDLTSETSPHNLDPYSDNFSMWGGYNNASVTTDVDGSADEIDDSDSNNSSYLEENGFVTVVPNEVATWVIKIKKDSNTTRFPEFLFRDASSKYDDVRVQLSTADGSISVQYNDSTIPPKVVDKGGYWLLSIRKGIQSSHNYFLRRIFPARAETLGGSSVNATGSIIVKESQVVIGDDIVPPFVATTGSSVYPQTVPALRQSSNDLTLGSTSSADTNDGQWIAPLGMAEDGDDVLFAPTKRPQVTRIHRVKGTQSPLMGRSANGWQVTATDLVVEDAQGNTASSAHGETIDDGSYRVLAVVVDTLNETARLYVDASPTPACAVDLSTISTLKSGDLNLLPSGGTLTHAPYMTRVLSGEEIAYVSQAIIDNPETAFPNYTTP